MFQTDEKRQKDLTNTSVNLCYVLRHKPESIGITLDSQGWVDIHLLLKAFNEKAKKKKIILDRATLDEIVEKDEKKRYTISEDGLRIRAAQGHSTSAVKIEHKEKKPPDVLFHGTSSQSLNSIISEGICSLTRHHVHLSLSKETATEVGKRHGKPIIFEINTKAMHLGGFKFFEAENGVWLTEEVPYRFCKMV